MKQSTLIFYKDQKTDKNISDVFEAYLKKSLIFKDKKVLFSSFVPDKILHRDNELMQLSSILAPSLRGYKPSNIFLYGGVGTGKTVCVKQVLFQLNEIAKKNKTNTIKTFYINCKLKRVADTEYRLLAQLLDNLNITVPDTGLPTDVLYRRFFNEIDKKNQIIIIVLDEIDALVRKIGDDFLYNLTRAEMNKGNISLIGITNNLVFSSELDARVKSSLGEEEIIFKPYNAVQLKDILRQRAEMGFYRVSESVINKCAALAAQEHGDARRALDLLRVAGEIAERNGESEVREEHVDLAEEKINLDCATETIKSLPRQSQAILYAILKLHENNNKEILTGDIFSKYKEICMRNNLRVLTQRRVSDLLNELEMFGIISAKVISKGRYGRTREISLNLNDDVLGYVKRSISPNFR